MNIKTYGTAFTSYAVKANKLTKEQISNEKVSTNIEVKKTNEIENISYHSTSKSVNSKFTVFKDPTNGKYVVSSLNDKTIEKLKTQFPEDNFIEKEDGSLRLTGKAEAFVSGWFADIAYKREFLESDKDNDGKLSEDEYEDTKNNFGIHIEVFGNQDNKNLYTSEKVAASYISNNKSDYSNYREFNAAKSLDDELNETINVDKNFDGIMTLTEAYTTQGDENTQNVVLRHLQEQGLPTEFLEDSQMSAIDILLVDAFDKFVQLEPEERKDFLSKLQEEMLIKRKEINKKMEAQEEIALEKYLKKMFEEKKFDEEVQEKGLEIHV